MATLVLDPSIFVDDDILRDIAESLSERLRRHRRLRGGLDRIIGNRWQEFEDDFARFLGALLFQTGEHGGAIVALHEAFPALEPDHVRDACEVFMEAALEVLPFHAAASLSELSEHVGALVLRALEPATSAAAAVPLAQRLNEAEEALRLGASLR
ncbi:hypothetical protein [Bosea sp. WAO]|uniref:hypothetical protein n=1 Tax=Bosea sp. WAO TaxID=406341 RepID=UPI0012EE4EDF|nr:hypothetical protein [Bosea sp. WAO]